MFLMTYLRAEIRRRTRQSLLTALGLALGVGLVIMVFGVSAGVAEAQAAVLHSLYGIGTDITVTKGSSGTSSPGPAKQDQLSVDAGLLPESSVAAVSRLPGVAAVAGGLVLTDTTLTGFTPVSYTIDGVDVAHAGLGPLASGTIAVGRNLKASDATSNVAVVDAGYAAAHGLSGGSTITIAGTPFRVVGIVRQSQGGGSADVYIPLQRAQALAGKPGSVSVIYVAASSAAQVPAVQAAISRLLPQATVTSASTLAGEVSGSLATTGRLVKDLGRWAATAALLTALAAACLLTTGAVGRRVREIGTLKALGWRSRWIVAQLLAESLVVGMAGAVMGITLGLAGCALVDAIAPALTAPVPGASGSGQPLAVHLTAPVSLTVIALAVLLSIGGAALAGALGAWRAARLRPAAALAWVDG